MRETILAAALVATLPTLVAPLPALAATPEDLPGLRWKARPVVVFADGPDDPRLGAQVAMLEAKAGPLKDHEVAVVRATGPAAALRRRYRVAPEGFAVVLVGKDGDAKKAWTEPVDPARILALIDAMPMRRDEVRGR